jgi:hypothetical protein
MANTQRDADWESRAGNVCYVVALDNAAGRWCAVYFYRSGSAAFVTEPTLAYGEAFSELCTAIAAALYDYMRVGAAAPRPQRISLPALRQIRGYRAAGAVRAWHSMCMALWTAELATRLETAERLRLVAFDRQNVAPEWYKTLFYDLVNYVTGDYVRGAVQRARASLGS